MKKIIFILIIFIILIPLHFYLLDNSENIASRYAIPYEEMNDNEAGKATWIARFNVYVEPTESSIASARLWHYRTYVSEHVSPIQEKLIIAVNIFFSVVYISLGFILLRILIRRVKADGGRLLEASLKKGGHFSAELTGKIGLKKAILNHQLMLAEKEFLRAKNLYDNGLINEAEFIAKKSELTSKIRNDNLLNREV
jgi:hypothetical protein